MSGAVAAAVVGASSPVMLVSFAVDHLAHSPNDASVEYRVDSDGNVYKSEGGVSTLVHAWRRAGASADYDVRATLVSGTAPGGSATGAFLNCGSDRAWSQLETFNGYSVKECSLLIEISRAGVPSPILASATIPLTATVEA